MSRNESSGGTEPVQRVYRSMSAEYLDTTRSADADAPNRMSLPQRPAEYLDSTRSLCGSPSCTFFYAPPFDQIKRHFSQLIARNLSRGESR